MDDDIKKIIKDRLDKHIEMIPHHMRDSVYGYVFNKLEPGSFLTSVLCNDLKGAVSSADQINKMCLVEWAQFMMWAMPSGAQGSISKVREWLQPTEHSEIRPDVTDA